jgi:hypothetical protein
MPPIEPYGNILGLIGGEQLLDTARTQACGRRNLPVGEASLMGGHHRPDAFPVSVFKMCGSQPQPGHRSRLVMGTLP